MFSRLNHHFARVLNYLVLAGAVAVGLAGIVAAFTGCATTEYVPATRADSALVAAGLPAKIKARTVILQVEANPTATVADNRKAGQRQGSAATAPAAVASNANQRSSGPSWWVYLLVAVVGAVGWEYVSHQISAWLPWRTKLS